MGFYDFTPLCTSRPDDLVSAPGGVGSPPSLMAQDPPVVAVATASLPFGNAHADETLPNLAGTYRCEPQPAPCTSGQTFTLTQSGDRIEFKSEDGVASHARFTSPISLSGSAPWNSLAVITPDKHVQWSNGTQWRQM